MMACFFFLFTWNSFLARLRFASAFLDEVNSKAGSQVYKEFLSLLKVSNIDSYYDKLFNT